MKCKSSALLCILALLPVLQAGAFEFHPVGYESIGMGGAGVACASGVLAGYYNPALLAERSSVKELNVGGGIGIRDNNLVQQVNQLTDMKFCETLDRMAGTFSLDKQTAQSHTDQDRLNLIKSKEVLAEIGNGSNLSVMPAMSFGSQLHGVTIGMFTTSEIAIKAVISPTNTEFIFKNTEPFGNAVTTYYAYDPGMPGNPASPEQTAYNAFDAQGNSLGDLSDPENPNYTASLPESYVFDPTQTEENYTENSVQYSARVTGTTSLTSRAILLTEVPISYAKQLSTRTGTVSLGGSVAALQGVMVEQMGFVDTKLRMEDMLKNDEKLSAAIGIDLGALYEPKAMPGLTVGIVGKHLNAPTFRNATRGGRYAIDPMCRAGVKYSMLGNTLDLAADCDITNNATAGERRSQYLGGGVNYHPTRWLSLRAGAMRNLAENDELIYTAGVGLGLKRVEFNLAAQASSSTFSYKSANIPSYSRLNVSCVSHW